jgi:hypothetical protein
MATLNPACAIGLQDEIGSNRRSACACFEKFLLAEKWDNASLTLRNLPI